MAHPPESPGNKPYRRQLKNMLLDRPFQLRFAAYFVVLTLIVAALLGAVLFSTTSTLFAQANEAVDARSRAAQTSRDLGTCTLNNELARNLDNPELAASLAERSRAIDARFEADMQAVLAQRADLVSQQRLTLWVLSGVLVAFIIAIALGSIVITHRIVGPLFRLKRMAREVARGVYRPPSYGLRPGDELTEAFELFTAMIRTLRAQAESDLMLVDQALGGDQAALARLKEELEQRLAREA